MLIALLITISRMQNAFPQSFPLILPISRGPDLNEVRWGIVFTPTRLPATSPLILGITALPLESTVEIGGMIPSWLCLPVCGWMWVGGEGRMCGLRQTAQTMSLVTSESSSWLLNLRSQNDRTPQVPVSLPTKWLHGIVNWETSKMTRYMICRFPSPFFQRIPSLRGRDRRFESLFKNSPFWCNLKLWQELVWFYHFQLIINLCQPPFRNLQWAFISLIKSRLTWALKVLLGPILPTVMSFVL